MVGWGVGRGGGGGGAEHSVFFLNTISSYQIVHQTGR